LALSHDFPKKKGVIAKNLTRLNHFKILVGRGIYLSGYLAVGFNPPHSELSYL
jgi:hypothetical protein